MSHILTLQLGCYEHTESILDLCKFPIGFMPPEGSQIRLCFWQSGKSIRKTFRSPKKLSDYLDQLKKTTFNDLEMKFSFIPFSLFNGAAHVLELECYFQLSPQSCLWGDVYGYVLEERSQEARREVGEQREIWMRHNEIERYPSLIQIILKFDSPESTKGLRKLWSELLLDKLRDCSKLEGFFGCGDIGYSVPFEDIIQRLAPCPKAIQELDARFDQYHDILINNVGLCKEICRDKNQENIIANFIDDNEGINIALISIEKSDAEAYRRHFLTCENKGEHQKKQSILGEFTVGGTRFITKRRLNELVQGKMIQSRVLVEMEIRSPVSHVYYSLIQEGFLPKLGIDPDDTILGFDQQIFVDTIYENVTKNYQSLIDLTNQRERIWKAHEMAYIETGRVRQDALAFLKSRFFPDL